MKTYSNTQGPWKIGSNGASVKVVDAEDKAICMLTPRKEAWNGDLIAAAPDLLDACRCALADLEGLAEAECFSIDDPAHRTISELRAAIKKATGEEQ